MRRLLSLFAFALAASVPASAQYCTGSCQTTPSCTQGQTTSVSGTVFAPNGIDPLPNVTVYIAGDTVGPLQAGVSCPVPGAIPAGSPVAGTTTATDGTFTITGVPINPAGQPQALVMVSGKWRRIIPIDLSAGSCTNTAADPTMTRFPRTQAEGDIPKIAIATGNADPVECVLYKVMGNNSTEFTNPGGTGRINFFLAEGSKTQTGSYIGAVGATPSASTLMSDPNVLGTYDVVMLPCEGGDNTTIRQASETSGSELTNLKNFANVGGRIYASHYSYDWFNESQTFPNVVNWTKPSATLANGNATVNTKFGDGATLAAWLALPSVGASTTTGQIALQTLRQDFSSVNAPTQSWMTLNSNSATMQFTFDTPVGQTVGQCGRVLFNEYHVETTVASSNQQQFPNVCGSTTTMTPQEKLLEYMLFNLTSNGGDPTMTPTSADFGQQPIGFTSSPQIFTWTNNSIFNSAVTSVSITNTSTTSGTGTDFVVVSNNCSSVAPKASCQIGVAFAPSVLGARAGTLNVGGGGKTLTATLTGTGVPALVVSTTSMTFPSVDITASSTQSFLLTNSATGPVPVPALIVSGDFTAAGAGCGSSLAAGASCAINVTFTPTTYGPRTGSLSFNSTYTSSVIALTGNGVDFTVALSPTSGTVIAGRGITTSLQPRPLGGYASTVSLSCSTTAPGVTCSLGSASGVPSASASVTVNIQTTSQYTVVGYGSLGGRGLLILLAGGSVWLLRRRLRGSQALLKAGLAILLLTASGFVLTGCGNLSPAQNSNYTPPGTYTITVTATDGTLTRSTPYSLTVTKQ